MRPEELIDKIKEFLEDDNHQFGFQYVSFGDGVLIPQYPAALVLYDSAAREIHGTHYFLTNLNVEVVIMHANLSQNRQERTKADMELATAVVTMIHSKGLTLLDPRIHKSFVTDEQPSLVSTDNLTAIGTSLSIIAQVREAFK